MAYADSIRATTARMNDVATLIEGVLIPSTRVGVAGVINTTSTSFVDYTSVTSTVSTSANESVFIVAKLLVSTNSPPTETTFQLVKDGSTIGQEAHFVSNRSSTGGADDTMVLFALDTPSAGSHTYKVQWKTSANTSYSASGEIYIFQFQSS